MKEETLAYVAEESALEEGLPAPKDGVRNRASSGKPNRLSMVSKKYDINGDGVLDEAERTMRAMDTSNRGFLTNDKVYDIVQQQIALQNQMFNMKKILIGLSCFTVVLALSNLGTAWAAAVLAKDTRVDPVTGAMITKAGDNPVATKPKGNKIIVQPPTDGDRRDLANIFATAQGTITYGDAVNMFADCGSGTTSTLNMVCTSSTPGVTIPCDSFDDPKDKGFTTFTYDSAGARVATIGPCKQNVDCPVVLATNPCAVTGATATTTTTTPTTTTTQCGCPANEPTQNDSCCAGDGGCTYENSAYGPGHVWDCDLGTWQVRIDSGGGGAVAVEPPVVSVCPESISTAVGSCPSEGAKCGYDMSTAKCPDNGDGTYGSYEVQSYVRCDLTGGSLAWSPQVFIDPVPGTTYTSDLTMCSCDYANCPPS